MNKSERDKEAVMAGRIVDEETLKFQRWYQGVAITPTIQSLKKKMDDIALGELQRTLAKMPQIGDAERKNFAKMAEAIVAKILHDPLMYLKSDSCTGRDNSDLKVTIVRELFGLTKDEDGQRPH
jgi:glutamyl-tRNA reductase